MTQISTREQPACYWALGQTSRNIIVCQHCTHYPRYTAVALTYDRAVSALEAHILAVHSQKEQ